MHIKKKAITKMKEKRPNHEPTKNDTVTMRGF